MKKIIQFMTLFILIFAIFCCIFMLFFNKNEQKFDEKTYFFNAFDEDSYIKLQELKNSFETLGKKVKLSKQGNFASGKFNLYAAKSIVNLAQVKDKKAINILWLPDFKEENPEVLREFDVIVVENMPSFTHLKAINVRTAFIPSAINVIKKAQNKFEKEVMFFGEAEDGNSLALSLAGPTDLQIDVYGHDFRRTWPVKDIVREFVKADDFQRYGLVLLDQSEEELSRGALNKRLRTVIENGGLPVIVYNGGVEKIFGKVIPMYFNTEGFLPLMKSLLVNPQDIMDRKRKIREIAQSWNSESVAKKFIEVFDVMERKMR